MVTDYRELAKRVEALDGPDREIDAEIAREVGYEELFDGQWVSPDQLERKRCCEGWVSSDDPPAFTGDLKIALSLASFLPGLLELSGSWEPDKPEVWPAWTIRWYPRGLSGKDWHAEIQTACSPELAFCVTALCALARSVP